MARDLTLLELAKVERLHAAQNRAEARAFRLEAAKHRIEAIEDSEYFVFAGRSERYAADLIESARAHDRAAAELMNRAERGEVHYSYD